MGRRLAAAALAAGLLLAGPARIGALDQGIDDVAITQALGVARQDDTARLAFHQRYITIIGDSTYDSVEVIGEFRQVVLTAVERMLLDRRWNVSQARDALAPFRGMVTIAALIRFPPQNVLVSVPNYSLVVYPEGRDTPEAEAKVLGPVSTGVTMLFPAGGALAPTALPGSAMGGVRLTGTFATETLRLSGTCTVAITLDGVVQREVEVNLGGLQ
jgi:hypothetical protein